MVTCNTLKRELEWGWTGVPMDKKSIMDEIDSTIDAYCEGCFLKSHLVKNKGKVAAHRFCIAGCTVGDQLRFLGDQLNRIKK